MSYCDHFTSVVRLSVRPSVRPFTPLNDFSSVTPGPNFFKLHVEPCVTGGGGSLFVNQDGRHAAI